MIWELLFFTCIGFIIYSYAVYPTGMMLLGKRTRRCGAAALANPVTNLPRVDVIVAAHDEERHIGGRIQNILAQNYPPELLRILVGSDGSTDQTVFIAQSLRSGRVDVFAFEERRGKASVLNDLVSSSEAEILIFTDANTSFEPNAVRRLVERFSDPSVGAVSGELRLVASASGHNRDSSYWAFETAVKVGESVVDALLGANGGIYAIRRSAFEPIPADTIVDDFTIAMNVAVQGRRLVFEPAALAFEDAPSDIQDEFRRRIRIGAGNYQAFFRYPAYWFGVSAGRKFSYFSHKIVRWFTPHLLIVIFIASIALWDRPFFRAATFVQAAGYAILAVALRLERSIRLPRILTALLFLFALNIAFMIGFYRYLTGRVSGQWRRTARA